MVTSLLPKNIRPALATAAVVLLSASSMATVHTVTCQNGDSHFLPITVNAFVGDTIFWTWVSGTHVVGPITAADIPVGAGMWNVPVNASMQSFEYVVSVPGDYHYVCHPSAPHDEDGYITVSLSTDAPQPMSMTELLTVYPVPSNGKVTMLSNMGNAPFSVFNTVGEEVLRSTIPGQRSEVDLSDRPKGIYFIQIASEQGVLTRRVVIQ